MPKNSSQRGIAHVIVLAILAAGIVAGVYLVQKTQVFKPKAYNSDNRIDASALALDLPYQSVCDNKDPHNIMHIGISGNVEFTRTCPDNFPLCKQFAPGAAGCVANMSDDRGYDLSAVKDLSVAAICDTGSFGSINYAQATCINEKITEQTRFEIARLYYPPIMATSKVSAPEGYWCGSNAYPAIVNHWLKKYATASEKEKIADCLSVRCPVTTFGDLSHDLECAQTRIKNSWVPPQYDNQGKFVGGCRVGGERANCSDFGEKFYSSWSPQAFEECKKACSGADNATSSPIPKICPITASCCASGVDGDKTYFQTCGTTKSFDGKSKDTSCPNGYQWCYGGYCVNENYNPDTKKCII